MKTIIALAAAFAASTVAAQAADLPAKAATPAAVTTVQSWAGLYLGADVGGAWGRASTTDLNGGVPPGPFDFTSSGAVGGAHLGYNFVWQGFVFGPEISVGYLGATGSGVIPSSNPSAHQDLRVGGGLLVDVVGRVGYSRDGWLAYARAGYANLDASASQTTTNKGYVTTPSKFGDGWTVGGGIERMLGHGWTARAEYRHYDLGSKGGAQTSVSDPPVGYVYRNSASYKVDAVLIGVSWQPPIGF